jgi:hypothetical protein
VPSRIFAGDVPGDRRVLALAGDLVDLVDVDDPGLGLLHVVLGRLDQLEQDVLDILADVARLGEGGGVGDGERDVEQPGQRLGQQGLARPGGAEQQDVRLGQLDAVLAGPGVTARLDPLVVVVHRYGQGLLGLLLPDHVRVEELVDLAGLGQAVPFELGRLRQFLFDDLVAQVDALVTDVHAWSGDELLDLLLTLSAERALQQITTIADASHPATPLPGAVSPSLGLTAAFRRATTLVCLRATRDPPADLLVLTVPPPGPRPREPAPEPYRPGGRILLVRTTLPRCAASSWTELHPPDRIPWPPRR